MADTRKYTQVDVLKQGMGAGVDWPRWLGGDRQSAPGWETQASKYTLLVSFNCQIEGHVNINKRGEARGNSNNIRKS